MLPLRRGAESPRRLQGQLAASDYLAGKMPQVQNKKKHGNENSRGCIGIIPPPCHWPGQVRLNRRKGNFKKGAKWAKHPGGATTPLLCFAKGATTKHTDRRAYSEGGHVQAKRQEGEYNGLGRGQRHWGAWVALGAPILLEESVWVLASPYWLTCGPKPPPPKPVIRRYLVCGDWPGENKLVTK